MAGGTGLWDEKELPTSYVLAWKTIDDAASSASHPLESGKERNSCFSLCSQVSEEDKTSGYNVMAKWVVEQIGRKPVSLAVAQWTNALLLQWSNSLCFPIWWHLFLFNSCIWTWQSHKEEISHKQALSFPFLSGKQNNLEMDGYALWNAHS